MLLHHSQTGLRHGKHSSGVWYLMLLHHSQTRIKELRSREQSGILCFYIILKRYRRDIGRLASLVSYAFTSFSNDACRCILETGVWYLMLLHHSQTFGAAGVSIMWSGILCFYIILKHCDGILQHINCLVSYAFTSFSNSSLCIIRLSKCLVSYAFTSFSN